MINKDEVSSNYKLRFLDDLGNSYPNWKKDKLKNNVLKIKGGGTPFIGNKDFYSNGNIPFAKINDLTSQQKYVTYTNINITEEGLNNSSSWIIPENSILYSIYASIGFTAINKIKLTTNQAILGIIPNENKLVLNYLYYYLIFYKKTILKYINLGTQSNLNLQNVKNINLNLPSLTEQQKIGSFLSKIDDYIKLQKEEIILTNEYKKSLLEQIFNQQIKVLDENGNNYPNWKETNLEDYIKISVHNNLIKDETSSITNYEDLENVLVKTKQVSKDNLFTTRHELFLKKIDKSRITILPKNSILISKTGEGRGKICLTKFSSILDSTLYFIEPISKNLDNLFIFYFLYNQKEFLKIIGEGSTIKTINKNDIYNIDFSLPSIYEQQKIGLLLSNLDQQINQLELEYKNINEYKNILLNKLIF